VPRATSCAIASRAQGFLKPMAAAGGGAAPGVCILGVNGSYTGGHAVFGVNYSVTAHANDDTLDWFDDYDLDYAPYLR
jgi:hypothetical protein